jgi:general secretion pathway protein A
MHHMYNEFFGLKEKPFNLTPSPRFIYMSEGHREAMALLTYGVTERKGFILLTGEVGTGKTTLIHNLISNLDSSVEHVYLVNPLLTTQELMDFLAFSIFKKRIHFRSKADFLLEFQEYLKDCFQHQKIFILIIDEAHKLSFELLEEIRLLSNMESAEEKLINIFLVGQPELNDILNSPKGRATLQRIGVRYDIPPLDLKETGEYLEKRLAIAGAPRRGEIFQKDAIEAIYRCSQGLPRTINILADNAMLLAYSRDRKTIAAPMIEEAYKSMSLEGSFLQENRPSQQPIEVEEEEETPANRTGPTKKWRGWALISLAAIVLALVLVFFVPSLTNHLSLRHHNKAPVPSADETKKDATLTEKNSNAGEGAASKQAIHIPQQEYRPGPEANGITTHGESLKNLSVIVSEKDAGSKSAVAKKGDTLSDLAIKVYGVAGDDEISLLKKHNPDIKDVNLIEVGQKISFPTYTILIRTFKSIEKADYLCRQLKNDGFEANVVSSGPVDAANSFKVTVGAFKNKNEATSFAIKSLEGRHYNMPEQ